MDRELPKVYDEAFRLQTGGSVGRLIRGVERFVLSLGLSELRKWRIKGKKGDGRGCGRESKERHLKREDEGLRD